MTPFRQEANKLTVGEKARNILRLDHYTTWFLGLVGGMGIEQAMMGNFKAAAVLFAGAAAGATCSLTRSMSKMANLHQPSHG